MSLRAALLLTGAAILSTGALAQGVSPGMPASPPSPQVVPTTPAPSIGTVPTTPMMRPAPVPLPVVIEAGSGRLLQLPAPAMTVMAADPRIARVQPASPTSLFIMAVAAGRTTVVATAEDGAAVAEYDVTVRPGRGALAPQAPAPGPLEQIFGRGGQQSSPPPSPAAVEGAIRRSLRGTEGVRVTAAGPNTLVLNGTIANAADAQRAESIARGFAGEEREVINNLQLLSSIQVNVRVRVAEMSRRITRELGFNWAVFGQTGNLLLGMRTGAAAGAVGPVLGLLGAGGTPAITPGPGAILGPLSTTTEGLTPGRLGAGWSTPGLDLNQVVDALAADQLISILAEPNLTAQSGETASFLAGGEFPIPVGATGASGVPTIAIQFKEFGVSLAFVPTVLAPDRLNLRIRPEVSELTEVGAITLPLAGGTVRVPALTVRRAETTVELGSGQSFAIAGLMQTTATHLNTGLNGLGDVPVLGALFRSDRFRRGETELVILVTPYLVRPVSNPRALALPTDGFRPAIDIDRVLYQRQIARGAATPQLRTRPDAGFILE